MDMYFVNVTAEPTKGSEEYGEVGGANVDVFVKASSLSEAAVKAIDYIINRSWVVVEETSVLKMTSEQISKMDEIHTATYHRAKKEGMHAFFAAWPVEDRDDDLVVISSLSELKNESKTKH